MQAFIYIRDWLDSSITPLYTWPVSKSMNCEIAFVVEYAVVMVPQKSPGGDS